MNGGSCTSKLSCWQYSHFSSCWKQHVYKHALFCLSNSSPDSNLFTTQFRFFNKSNKKIKEHKNGSVDPAGEVQRGRAERAVVHFVLQPSSDPADWAGQRSDGAAESGDKHFFSAAVCSSSHCCASTQRLSLSRKLFKSVSESVNFPNWPFL